MKPGNSDREDSDGRQRVLIIAPGCTYEETLQRFLEDRRHAVERLPGLEDLSDGGPEPLAAFVDHNTLAGTDPSQWDAVRGRMPDVWWIGVARGAKPDRIQLLWDRGIRDWLDDPENECELERALWHCDRHYRQGREHSEWQSKFNNIQTRLRHLHERLDRILDFRRLIPHLASPSLVAEQLLEDFAALLAATGGSLYVREDDRLVLAAALDRDHVPEEIPLPIPEWTVFGKVLATRQPFLARDIEDEELQSSGWKGYRDGSFIAFPLLGDGQDTLGILSFHNKEFPPFNDEDLKIGQVLACFTYESLLTSRVAHDLRQNEERLRHALQVSQMGTFDWDIPTDRLLWSEEVPRMLEVEAGYLGETKDSFLRLIHPDDLDETVRRIRAALEEDEPYHCEHRIVLPDGSHRWSLCQGQVFRDEKGRPLHFWGTIRDITAQKRQQSANQQIEAKIQHAQKMESLGIMAGGIAHDFNNLLVGILGNASIARMKLPPNSPAREHLQDIEDSAAEAASLCRQMLAYAGKGPFHMEAVQLNSLISEMSHLLQSSVTRQAVIRYNLKSDLPLVEADASQIRQLLVNLVTNASDALEDRAGIISISTNRIYCDRPYLMESYGNKEVEEGLFVSLEVSDTGRGMDPGIQSRIFEPFYTTKFVGHGLGLAAVLGIVNSHLGAIRVYSEEGRGTTIKVLFPAAGTAGQEGPEEGARVESGASASPGTVLVVDDEHTVRKMIRSMLEWAGYEVMTAEDGVEAVDRYLEHAETIDAIVLDMTMPNMDGEETFRELRRMDSTVKVILMSGYNESDAASSFAGKGLVGFLQKPFRPNELLELLRQATGERADD